MRLHPLSGSDIVKSVVVGVVTAAVTGGLMFLAIKNNISPLPKPLALAFVQTMTGMKVPLPVGGLFHAVWVTFFTLVYVSLARDRLSFGTAIGLAFLLWLSVLFVFYPIVGWGVAGLNIGPKMILGAAIPHLIFAVLIWVGANLLIGKPDPKHEENEYARG